MAHVCIICQQEKGGAAVADTPYIQLIRRLKADYPITHLVLGKPTGHTLVVCPECRPVHEKRRKAFERKMMWHLVFGALLVLLAVVLPILGGSFNLLGIILMLLLSGFICALAMVEYVPPLARSPSEVAQPMQLPQPPTIFSGPAESSEKPTARAAAHPTRLAAKHAASKPKSKSARPAASKPASRARRR